MRGAAAASGATVFGRALAGGRSALAFALVLAWFVPGALFQRLVLWPAAHLFPARRAALVATFMKAVSAGIFALLRLGGARAERHRRVPTAEPALILMNHQSLLDIPTLILMADPYVPWFVTRARYGRYVPLVSLCLRLLGGPLIEPRRARRTLERLRQAAREHRHGLVLFPEGHRTRDGALQPFHAAGAEAILSERPVPVFLLVTDGYWTCRRLVDFLFNVHRIDGCTVVLGPFTPPGAEGMGDFLDGLHARMGDQLAAMRAARRPEGGLAAGERPAAPAGNVAVDG